MLDIRPNCENCGKDLPNTSVEALICSFECTYCNDCVALFKNVCPSCGGNFQPRPIRPLAMVSKYPSSDKRLFKPKDYELIEKMKTKYQHIKPEKR